jgi:hypothetical protein
MAANAIATKEIKTVKTMRMLFSAAPALGSVAALAIPSGASLADVYVVRPRPIVVAPAPRAYVAPAVAVSSSCATRSVRVWVDSRYVYRAVRVCP